MADLNSLIDRVDREFSLSEEKVKAFQREKGEAYQERQKRLAKLQEAFEKMQEVWRPRLQVLQDKFGDKIHVTPNIVPSLREARFEFQSKLANISLKFAASTNLEVTEIVLNYELRIYPTLMDFESHSELRMSLEEPDLERVAQWVDDRIVSFVHTYQSLHENEFYLKDHMVEDPVMGLRFPKFAASASLDWKGTTYYFASDETLREFQRLH